MDNRGDRRGADRMRVTLTTALAATRAFELHSRKPLLTALNEANEKRDRSRDGCSERSEDMKQSVRADELPRNLGNLQCFNSAFIGALIVSRPPAKIQARAISGRIEATTYEQASHYPNAQSFVAPTGFALQRLRYAKRVYKKAARGRARDAKQELHNAWRPAAPQR